MINPDFPPFGGPFHILGMIVWAMASFLTLVVIVAILVLLVRYLLVATRAHKLYIANNTPAAAPSAPAATPAAPATPAATTPTVVQKPVSKPRTPKAPPAV